MVFRDLPIKRKLRRVILFPSFAVLALMASVLLVYELFTYKRSTRRVFATVGQIVAENSSAVLIYDDHELAAKILAGIRAEPEIVLAALYDKKGKLFVSYPVGAADIAFPEHPGEDGMKFALHHVTLFNPVVEAQSRVGTLYLRGDLAGMYRRLGVYGLVLLGALSASAVVAFILSNFLQRLISQPVLREPPHRPQAILCNRSHSVVADDLSMSRLRRTP